MKPRQGELFGTFSLEHGGQKSIGKRKTMRPFDRKKPIHATFRAEKAVGRLSLLHRKHKGYVYGLADEIAYKSNVKLYRFVNVGNHVHVVLKARCRRDLQKFLRVFGGRIAMLVTKARKGRPAKFWDHSVHTKIVSFGPQWDRLVKYMSKNLYEAEGERVLLRMPSFDVYSARPS